MMNQESSNQVQCTVVYFLRRTHPAAVAGPRALLVEGGEVRCAFDPPGRAVWHPSRRTNQAAAAAARSKAAMPSRNAAASARGVIGAVNCRHPHKAPSTVMLDSRQYTPLRAWDVP